MYYWKNKWRCKLDIKIHDLYDKLNYIMKLEHRVTVIQGDSATGKSTLVRYIEMQDSMKVNIKSPKKLLATNISNLMNIVEVTGNYSLNSEYIYVLDEYDGIDNPNLARIINNSTSMFIIITRDASIPNINYGIDQIYQFKNSGKYNYLTKMYNNLNDRNINLENITEIITEDSGSGFEFYNTFRNFHTLSSYGNSNVIKLTKNNQIIVIDALGFGPFTKALMSEVGIKNIFIIYPPSFEYLLIKSLFWNKYQNNIDKNKKNITNHEQYYHHILKNLLVEFGINYSKSHLNPWFIHNPQLDKINGTIKSWFNIDLKELDKRKDNLENNNQWGWN